MNPPEPQKPSQELVDKYVHLFEEDDWWIVTDKALDLLFGTFPRNCFAVDEDGNLYVVETKLYKNPDKRTLVAQALDYGASLWRHADFNDLVSTFDQTAEKQWKMPFRDKLAEFFSFEAAGTDLLIDAMRRNLSDGKLKFVVLMDELEDRLKDLITYVNENSQFDIYAVQIEYYRHEEYEIVIPKLYGTEVRKAVGARSSGKLWTWDLFKERLQERGKEDVEAAQHIIDWAGANDIKIDWSTSQRGGFILCYYPGRFFPFAVTGDGMISWNAPHQRRTYPSPFDRHENRAEILKRLQRIKGATVDLNNVDGYSGLKLPLRMIADKEARDTFLSVCLWIKEMLPKKV